MSLLSHDRYQYDSLICVQTDLGISSSTLATAVVMRFFSSFKLTGGGTKILSLIYPHKKKSQGVKSGLLHNVESVYFFYSNPAYILTSNFQLEVKIIPNSRATDQLLPGSGHTALHAPHKTFSTLTSNFVTKSNPLNFIRVRHNAALQIQNSKFSPNAQLLSLIAYSVPQSNSKNVTFCTFPTVYLASSLISP